MADPDFDQILASLQTLDDVIEDSDEAFRLAQGVYADNPVTPSVMAMVWKGKVGDLQIADGVCDLPLDTATRLINAVVINAFNAWHLDLNQLIGHLQPHPAAT